MSTPIEFIPSKVSEFISKMNHAVVFTSNFHPEELTELKHSLLSQIFMCGKIIVDVCRYVVDQHPHVLKESTLLHNYEMPSNIDEPLSDVYNKLLLGFIVSDTLSDMNLCKTLYQLFTKVTITPLIYDQLDNYEVTNSHLSYEAANLRKLMSMKSDDGDIISSNDFIDIAKILEYFSKCSRFSKSVRDFNHGLHETSPNVRHVMDLYNLPSSSTISHHYQEHYEKLLMMAALSNFVNIHRPKSFADAKYIASYITRHIIRPNIAKALDGVASFCDHREMLLSDDIFTNDDFIGLIDIMKSILAA